MEWRLAAVLAADAVNYSRLMGRDEVATLATLRAHRDELIDPEVTRHGGRIVKTTGDGLLVEFKSVVAAVRCAVEVQRGMADRNRDVPTDQRLAFRVGVNLDDVIVVGDDIFGDGVNVAARLESIAEPGTVCVSGTIFDRVKDRVDCCFTDLGLQHLRGFAEPVRVCRVEPTGARSPPSGPDATAATSPALPTKPSIAILPLTNLSSDPKDDYLVDGLQLDVQAALVHASGLFRIAPSTSNRYRGAGVTPERAGREMGVRYVLGGAVRRSGQRVRVTMELTDVEARQIIWAEHYDRTFEDGFAVQDEITAEVLKALDVKLVSGENWLLHRSFKSLESLDLFFRALSLFYAENREANAGARELFVKLARLEPGAAIGPAYLCFTHWLDAFRGWTDTKERSLAEAARWAETAVRLRGPSGLPEIVLASVQLLNRRHDEALATCYRAVALRPNCPIANSYMANVLLYCGHPAEAIAKIQAAMRITPVYPPWYMALLAAAYRDGGDIPSSIASAEQAIRMSSAEIDARLVLCSDHGLSGRWHEARRVAQEILAAEPSFSLARHAAAQPYEDDRTLRRLVDHLREAGLPD